ncbi:MAG: hypothetical protein ACI3Y7_07625 [Candidatus Cryptobacteroides sp.]
MPKYIPNTQFFDCWSSVGNVTFYHRNGICYFRSKAYSDFAGTAEQLEQAELHKRAIKAWQGLAHEKQMIWRKMARGVASHRPPFGQKNSISGYNLFVSAYHGFAQLGNEHIPEPVMFEPFPIFSLDYLNFAAIEGGVLRLHFRLTLCGANDAVRYRVLGKFQLGEPGCGRNPGLMRNCLSYSVPSGECSMVEFLVSDTVPGLEMKQLHLRYLLLDTKTGNRSQYHSLTAIIS